MAGYPAEESSQSQFGSAALESLQRRRMMRDVLVGVIRDNGQGREDRRNEEYDQLQRAQEAAALAGISETAAHSFSAADIPPEGEASAGKPPPFCADLVYREESGFELWLGSLEDALSLEGLKTRQINGVLNCALEECRRECATFRCGDSGDTGPPTRRRTHARGASLANDGEAKANKKRSMPADVLRGLAEFDGDWYSDFLDCDMAYHGLEALDEDGYRMDHHFAEVQEFLHECRQEGRKVLVHCIMGINRSSVALVAFLCSGLGMDLSSAIAMAAAQRGFILSNNSFIDQLIERFGFPEEALANVNAEAIS